LAVCDENEPDRSLTVTQRGDRPEAARMTVSVKRPDGGLASRRRFL
jgi:hypothetical protein